MENLSANKGRITHLKASASKLQDSGESSSCAVMSQNSSLKWAEKMKVLLLGQASVSNTK